MILQFLCSATIPKSFLHTEQSLVRTLKSNNETLQNINIHFNDIYERFKIIFFYETVMTELWRGRKDFVVDRASAAPMLPNTTPVGIEANHSQMCKFENKDSPGYMTVTTTIRSWVVEAPQLIIYRFAVEDRARQQVRENDAREMLGIYGDGVS